MLAIRKRILPSLFLAALLAAPTARAALSFGAGPIIGAEFGNASIENHDNADGRTGLAVGLRTEFGVTRPYSLLIEPAYVQKGARFDTFGGIAKAKGDLDYLEIPVLLKAKFGALKAHAYGILGPSFGINLNAKGTLGNFSDTFKDQAANLEIAGDVGAGAGFQVSKFLYFTADARYSHGFTNALDKDVGDISSWKSRDIRVLAGLLIHLTE
jgi:hypothetical protein